MDKELAIRRGVSLNEIGFFDSIDELRETLTQCGWNEERVGDGWQYLQDGVMACILVKDSGLVSMRTDNSDGVMHDYGLCSYKEVLRIGGSIIVGSSIEI